MHIRIDEIETIHLDITTICNALCVFCPRTKRSTVGDLELSLNEYLPLKTMSDQTINSLFSDENMKRMTSLKIIEICPTYGDPLAASNLLQTVELIMSKNSDIVINIHTNGSIGTPALFQKLAVALGKNPKSKIRFSIDGLEHNNNYHRKGVDWNKAIANLKAFVAAGGHAVWKTVVFDYNRDTLSEIEEYAYSLGVSSFDTVNNSNNRDLTEEEKHCDNLNFKSVQRKINYDDDHGEALESSATKLSCYWKEGRQVYCSVDGGIWPCCFFSNSVYSVWDHKLNEIKKIKNQFGDFNDINQFNLQQILGSSFFKKLNEGGYSSPMCVKTCGRRNRGK